MNQRNICGGPLFPVRPPKRDKEKKTRGKPGVKAKKNNNGEVKVGSNE